MKKTILFSIKLVLVAAFLILVYRYVDVEMLWNGVKTLAGSPVILIGMTAAYAAAFLLKALAWRLYLPQRPRLAVLWHGLMYSLLLNHVLPVKAGDAARVGVLWRYGAADAGTALHSVAALRALDMAALLALAAAGAPLFLGGAAALPAYAYAVAFALAAAAAALAIPLAERLPHAALRRHAAAARAALSGPRGAAIAALTLASWLLEGAVVLGAAAAVAPQAALTALEAVWATALTIAGGPAYTGPGGIGGYESTLSFALTRTGFTWADALTVAVVSHAYKFMFSYAAGLISWLLLPIRPSEWRGWLQRRKDVAAWTAE